MPTASLQTALAGTGRFPLLVEPGDALSLHQCAQQHEAQISQLLLEHGALLFRGFGVREVEFGEFLEDIRLQRQPAAGLRDAIEALRIIERIYEVSGYDHDA